MVTLRPIHVLFFILGFLSLNFEGVQGSEKIRLACLGDSITVGVGAQNRKELSYPSQLQKLLGDQYLVKNFGKCGIKMTDYLNKWRETIQKFQPQIVTIKLGTNDTKGRKFDPPPGNKAEFIKSYSEAALEILQFLQRLESKPQIYICLPVPVFQDKWGINERSLTEDILPTLKKISAEQKLGLIDFYSACKDKGKDVPDGVHPNENVYTLMAEMIFQKVRPKK